MASKLKKGVTVYKAAEYYRRGERWLAVVTLWLPKGTLVTRLPTNAGASFKKTRASRAVVISIDNNHNQNRFWDRSWRKRRLKTAQSGYDSNFVYRVGETVYPGRFDRSRKICSAGIHFFYSRTYAMDYRP